MQSHKLSIKFFLNESVLPPAEAFVPVFHSWIQDHKLPDHLLIDVADYAHVPEGPGMLLVAHEANIHIDYEHNQPGLLYVRKRPAGDSFEQRLRTILRGALRSAVLLEDDAALGGLKVKTDRAIFRIHDRLLGPNTPDTFAAMRPDLERILGSIYGAPVTLAYKPDSERLFEVDISADGAPDPRVLLERV